jgi:hypothetical protein
MADVEGSFTMRMDTAEERSWTANEPVQIYFYGPADLPWWEHWLYRIMGKLRGWPYPERIIASGPATFHSTDGEGETVTFTSAGTWKIDP